LGFTSLIETRLSWNICVVYSLLCYSIVLGSCHNTVPIRTLITLHWKISSESNLMKLLRINRTSNSWGVWNIRLPTWINSHASLWLVWNGTRIDLPHVMLIVTLSNIRFHAYGSNNAMRIFSCTTFHFFLRF